MHHVGLQCSRIWPMIILHSRLILLYYYVFIYLYSRPNYDNYSTYNNNSTKITIIIPTAGPNKSNNVKEY